jgi:6-phosphogluconolactonase/glucosamine-6-phosphate isomerase/deaminase
MATTKAEELRKKAGEKQTKRLEAELLEVMKAGGKIPHELYEEMLDDGGFDEWEL